MLLTITTTRRPATDLGFLLHKHPDKCQSFDLGFGTAHAYYPEAGDDRCTACLLLEIDAVGLMRGRKPDNDFLLAQYVNDRPYVASSFLSVALSRVFGSALAGRCKDRPELAAEPLPLEARLDVLPVRGGEPFLRAVFEPLGYEVEAVRHPLDERFLEWGDGPYFSVTVRHTVPLATLLTHLYVLVPVFDARKHYFVGGDEVEKLLAKGGGWLAGHPAKDEIARRYLGNRPSLYRLALGRLEPEDDPLGDDDLPATAPAEEALETPLSLNDQRLEAVAAAIRATGAKRVIDLGCGEGKLIRELLKDRQIDEVVGMDVSVRALEAAARRLKLDHLSDRQASRVKLIHGSLLYRDKRLAGFDAAAVVEVVEHLDPPRLAAFERVVFAFARPRAVVLTTPNRDYNAVWKTLPAGTVRHPDHRFEWSRSEFRAWATGIATRFGLHGAVPPGRAGACQIRPADANGGVRGSGRDTRTDAVEAVIFVGLQGAGKSTFYQGRFADTHVRVNLDMLKTRHRERRLLDVCIETRQPFVVDNTNPTRAERAVYVRPAKDAGFRVVGYYFRSRVEDCRRRNDERSPERRVPLVGLLGTAGRLELPTRDEGFDALFYVRIDDPGGFVVEEWADDVR